MDSIVRTTSFGSAVAASITASALATHLHEAYVVRLDEKSSAVSKQLASLQFDQAPVVDPRGRVVGVVFARELTERATVARFRRPLHECAIVSAETGLLEVMTYLLEEDILLILEGRSIVGLVCPADLGRPAARTYYYLLLAELEATLAEYLRTAFPHQGEAISQLRSERQTAINTLLKKLREEDALIDIVGALSLSDLLQIANYNKRFHEAMVTQEWSWRQLTGKLTEFRNDVMHPVRPMRVSTKADIGRLLWNAKRLQHMISVTRRLLEDAPQDR